MAASGSNHQLKARVVACLGLIAAFVAGSPAAAQTTAVVEPTANGRQRITLLGASFEVPADWKVTTSVAWLQIQGPDHKFSSSENARRKDTDLFDALRRSASRRRGVLSDLEVPGGRGFVVREDGEPQMKWFYWVELGDSMFQFECVEFSRRQGPCAATIRTFRAGPAASAAAATPAARPQAVPLPKPPQPTSPGATAMMARWMQDPRLAPLTSEQRAYAIGEAGGFIEYCGSEFTLNSFYDCSCLGGALLARRLNVGFEAAVTPTMGGGSVTSMTVSIYRMMADMGGVIPTAACIVPQKLRAWAIERSRNLVRAMRDPAGVSECAAQTMEKYVPRGLASMREMDRQLGDAVVVCGRGR